MQRAPIVKIAFIAKIAGHRFSIALTTAKLMRAI
jgi:hypothetical protein